MAGQPEIPPPVDGVEEALEAMFEIGFERERQRDRQIREAELGPARGDRFEESGSTS